MKAKDLIKDSDTVILLSLQEEYFNQIKSGKKKFEYRKKFRKEPTKAFIYVSRTKKAILGLIDFGTPIYQDAEQIAQIAEKEKRGSYDSIISYIGKGNKGYAIPVKHFYSISSITLDEIKETIPRFYAPQSYLLLKPDMPLRIILEEQEILENDRR